jgi:hypothetical protein
MQKIEYLHDLYILLLSLHIRAKTTMAYQYVIGLTNRGLYQVSTHRVTVPSSPLQNVVSVQPSVQMPFQAPKVGSYMCNVVLKTIVSHARNAPVDNCIREPVTILSGMILQVILDPSHPLWACVFLSNGMWKWIGRHHLQ